MKPLLFSLVFMVLVVVGYLAGSQLRGNSVPGEKQYPSDDPASSAHSDNSDFPGDGLLRDPRTGATFAESREHLEKFAQGAKNWRGASYFVEGRRRENDQLEIERTFSLATKEEMVAFFAEEDLSELDDNLLSAAYARLATLAPGEAAAIWTDRFRNGEGDKGIDGLVHAWALQDPAAAEEWVDALSDSGIRDTALLALLDGAMDSDPDLVERRFTEVEDMFGSINLAARLAWTLDPADFPALAERIRSVRHGKWKFQNQLLSVLKVWAQQDGESMMAWLGKQPPGSLEEHVVPELSKVVLKHGDPAAIARELGPVLDENKSFAQLAGQAWLSWLTEGKDDEGALEWLRKHEEHLDLSGWGRWNDQAPTSERASQILPLLAELPNGSTRTVLVRAFLRQLSESEPRAALEWAQEHQRSSSNASLEIAGLVSTLARKESPESALEWTLENLSSGTTRGDSVRFLMNTWARSHPRDAADRARSLPESLRKEAFSGISYEWAESAPDQVLDYLETHRDPDSMEIFAKSAMWQIGYHHGGDSHLDEALDLPDGKMKQEAVQSLIAGWARANLEDSAAALNTFEPGPVRDGAIERFVTEAARNDRASALTWSLAIDDPGKRRTTALKQARNWLKADRAKAARWIESSDDLPPEWKEQLLEPKDQKDR